MKKILIFTFFIFLIAGLCFGETPASLKKIINEDMIVQPDPENPFQGTWFYNVRGNYYFVNVIVGMRATAYHYISKREGWKRHSVYTIEQKGDIYTIQSPLGGDSQLLLYDDNLLTILNITYERYEK